MERIDNGSSLSVAKQLGYTGSSNAEFDTWYKSLSSLEQEAISSGNSSLVSYIKALNSTDDPYRRQQLENSLNSFRSQVFEPTFLQRIGEDLFGDTSARTNFQNQVNDKLIQDIKGIQEGLHTEEYTNPAAELARRKAAGINDDLSGASQIGSGEPGAIDEPELAPGVVNDGSSSLSDIYNIGQSIVAGIINCISGTIGIAKDIQGFFTTDASIVASEFENIKSADSWLLNAIGSNMPDSFFDKDYSNTDDFNQGLTQMLLSSLDNVVNSADFNRLSRSSRKYLTGSINRLKSGGKLGMKTLYQELYNNYLSARKNTVDIRASKGFSDDIGEWISNIEPHLAKLFDSEEWSWDKIQEELRGLKNDNDLKEYRIKKIDSLDGIFKDIVDAIPKDATWKPFGVMVANLVKMGLIQKFFSE